MEIVLGYYHKLGSLRYRNEYCVEVPLQLKPFLITQCNCTSIGSCSAIQTNQWRWAATHAGPITRAVDAIVWRSLERGGPVSRGLATGLLLAAKIPQTLTGEKVYLSSAKDFPDFLNRERVEHPFLWGDIVSWQHVCSLVHFSRHMRRPQWAQICLSPDKKVIRQHAEALRDEALLVKLTLSPRQHKWLRRRVFCDVETASDWARMSQSLR